MVAHSFCEVVKHCLPHRACRVEYFSSLSYHNEPCLVGHDMSCHLIACIALPITKKDSAAASLLKASEKDKGRGTKDPIEQLVHGEGPTESILSSDMMNRLFKHIIKR